MRPIYNISQHQKTSEPTTLIQSSHTTSSEIYATIDDVSDRPVDKFKQWKQKELLDKTTNYSPQPTNGQNSSPTSSNVNTSPESFFLPRNSKSGKSGLLPKTSTIIETGSDYNNNNTSTMMSAENQIDSSAGSSVLSHIDTTPLFSPSQIMKLNRQRKQRSMEKGLDTIQQEQQQQQPEFCNVYQKLKHVKPAKNIVFDLNNNEETPVKEEMPKPAPTLSEVLEAKEPAKADPTKVPVVAESTTAVDSQSSTKNTTEINSSTTVFTFKKSIEKSEPPATAEVEPTTTKEVPTLPVPQKTVTTTTTTTTKQTTANPVSPTKTNNCSPFVLNKDVYAAESIYSPQYRSTISPRHTVVSRRSNVNSTNQLERSYNASNNSIGHSTVSFSDSPISLRPSGASSQALRDSRQKEKQQLGELNDRFAGYVERVRFLEAQNKKLSMELGSLKGKWGSETKQIEQMYKIELDEARAVLNDTAKTKDCVQLIVSKQEGELDNMRRKYQEVENVMTKEKQRVAYLQEQISANESEISLLKRRLQDLQDEEKRYKQEAARMVGEIQRVSYELETEMKSRLMLENDKQSLEEELIFLKEIHAKEIEELKHLQFQHQGIDPAIFFKNELSQAIKEIRDEYESLNLSQRSELEGWYRIKVSEIQRKTATKAALTAGDSLNHEQSKRLKQQITDSKRDCSELKSRNTELELRIRELEEEIKRESREGSENISYKDSELNTLKQTLSSITAEYEELMLSKSDLESEIRTYRKLLEGGEENDGLKQIVEGIERRAKDMSINKPIQKSMNRSYTVDTGYSSGAYTHKISRKSLSNNHSFDCHSSGTNNNHSLNQTMPSKLYSNFAQRFEINNRNQAKTNPNKTTTNTTTTTTTKTKQFYLSNPVQHNNNTSLNGSLLANKSSNSFLDNSNVSNTSESSHYSALFSR